MKCNPVWLIRYELPFSFLVSSILQSVQCTGYIYMVCLINFAWQRKTYKTNPLLTCQKQQPKPISMAIFHEKQADCPSEKKKNKTQKHQADDSIPRHLGHVPHNFLHVICQPNHTFLQVGFLHKKHGAVIVCLENLKKYVETLGLLDSSR